MQAVLILFGKIYLVSYGSVVVLLKTKSQLLLVNYYNITIIISNIIPYNSTVVHSYELNWRITQKITLLEVYSVSVLQLAFERSLAPLIHVCLLYRRKIIYHIYQLYKNELCSDSIPA